MARARNGASWFNAIALFSVINAVIGMVGAQIHFIIGLGLCEIIDGIGQSLGTAGKGVAFFCDLLVAGVWVLFAFQGKKGLRWPFIVGMVLYLFDGLLFLFFHDYLAAAFHAYVLFRLFVGFQATAELKSLGAAASAPGAWYANPSQPQPGAWPPPPAGQQPTFPPPQAGGYQQPGYPQQGSQPTYPQQGTYGQQPSYGQPGGQMPAAQQPVDPYALPADGQAPRTSLSGEPIE